MSNLEKKYSAGIENLFHEEMAKFENIETTSPTAPKVDILISEHSEILTITLNDSANNADSVVFTLQSC